MPLIKDRKKIIYQADTKEYFMSIAAMPKWCKILIENIDKPYNSFVQFLLEKNFYNEREERLILKNIAAESGVDISKVTKWLKQIYEDIIELNSEKPELFKTEGVQHILYCRRHDSSISISVWLLNTPRLFETFEFDFANARTGSRYFFVEKVEHTLYNHEHTITVFLRDGFANKYRELLVDRAEFYGVINFTERYKLLDFQIDDEIMKFYKF